MAVVLFTTKGAVVVDLFLKYAPMHGFNFLKLSKMGWFTNLLMTECFEDFFVKFSHLDDPHGKSIYQILDSSGPSVADEITDCLSHSMLGVLSSCNTEPNNSTSNFMITLGSDLSRFDGIHTIFGRVAEGMDAIIKASHEICDDSKRPLRNVRVLQAIVLYDPFEDPPGFNRITFKPFPIRKERDRIEEGEEFSITPEQLQLEHTKLQNELNSTILEIAGEIPDGNAKPSPTTIFVCKLHPATTEDSLRIAFMKYGKVKSVSIQKDKKTGNSLCYGFIDFETQQGAERAYIQGQRMYLDGRYIHVDFSQSLRHKSNSV